VTGEEGVGKMNENGAMLVDFYTENNVIIGGSFFQQLNIKLMVDKDKYNSRPKYNLRDLNNKTVKQLFSIEMKNRFEPLRGIDCEMDEMGNETEMDIENLWTNIKRGYIDTTKCVLKVKPRERKEWITDETWLEIEQQKEMRSE
jgi:hypothetical protein